MRKGRSELNLLALPSVNISLFGTISSLPTNTSSNLRFISPNPIELEGLANGFDGKSIFIQNIFSNSFVIKNLSGVPSEQIVTSLGTDYSLPIGSALHLMYDGVAQKWRVANPIAISGGSGTFTNASPTPATIGGIPAGSTFLNQTLQQMFDALLYPFQNPAFTSFTSPLFTTYEVGEELPVGLATINYAISNFSNVNASSGVQSTNISGATFPVVNPLTLVASGSFQINIAAATTLTSPGSRTISLSGTNVQSGNFSASGTLNWRFRVFSGNSLLSVLTENDVEGLSDSLLSSTSARTYTFGAAPLNYKWICYPTTMTTLTSFIDTATNFVVPFDPPIVVSVTNPYGVVQNYNCHRSTNQLGGAISVAAS